MAPWAGGANACASIILDAVRYLDKVYCTVIVQVETEISSGRLTIIIRETELCHCTHVTRAKDCFKENGQES